MPIITAAPWTEFLGVKDSSTRERVITSTPVPSHLPLILTYAEKGDTEVNLVSGDLALDTYGDGIFDVRSKFATHQTVLAQMLNSVGNALMVKRVIPEDAPPPANMRISVEVVKTQVNPKKRLENGRYELASDGAVVEATSTIEGYKVKFITEYVELGAEKASQIGKGQVSTGTLLGTVGEESKRYPLFDFEVATQGSYGNLLGVRIWSATRDDAYPVKESLVTKAKAYPYYMGFIKKDTPESTAKFIPSDYGENVVQLTLKPGTYDPDTDAEYYVGTEMLPQWAVQDPTIPVEKRGPFGRIHVYQDNIDELQKAFAVAEKAAIQQFMTASLDYDFDLDADDDEFRFNIFGGHSTQGVPYFSYEIVKEAVGENVLRFTENSNIMASGGGDGTLSMENFNKLVASEAEQFGDKNSKYQDLIRYPFSVFYDTGFETETKKALCKIIAVRKDVCLALVPSVYGERDLTPSEEASKCTMLRTLMQSYPESTFWGTPVMRGMIFAHTGKLLNSRYRERAPLVIEAAYKFAKYMGASNGQWKNEYSPDSAANNRVELFGQISESYKPALVRNRDWKAGMIWVDACDLKAFYWPALRTVYEDDTSVLTSAITMFGICELEKIGERVATRYRGNSKLTNGQLKARIEQDYLDMCADRFDDRFDIKPEVLFSKGDIARGYSWILRVEVAAANMKTVQTLYIESKRKDEEAEATTSLAI